MGKYSNDVFVNIVSIDCLRMREANIQILLKYLNKVLRLSEATNCIPETSHLWEVLNSKENIWVQADHLYTVWYNIDKCKSNNVKQNQQNERARHEV